MSVLKVLSN